MRRRQLDIGISLDPHDPKYQRVRLGDFDPVRLNVTQVKQVIALLSRHLPEQERHVAGARIVLPAKVERLA